MWTTEQVLSVSSSC